MDLRPKKPNSRPERPDLRPERLDLRPERVDLRPERLDLRPERPDLRPERPDLRPKRLDLRPKRPDLRFQCPDFRPKGPNEGGGTDKRTDERTKVLCVLQDIVPFGAAAQKQKMKVPLCSTGHLPLWDRCPANHHPKSQTY